MLRISLLAALIPAVLPAADLTSLSWLAGRWINDEKGSLSEEIWSPVSGDSMMGMWRMVREGKTRIFELLAIKQEAGGVTLLLRHFDPSLAVRASEKDGALRFKLLPGDGKTWTFEGAENGATVRLIYSRPDEESLQVILDKSPSKQVFRFRRAKH